MSVLNLGCMTTTGDPYDFSVLDVPVLIDDSRFVLLNKPGSPILLINTVVAGSDIPNIYEGSVIVSDGIEYIISYKRGFAAMDKNKNVKKLSSLSTYVKIGQLYRFPERTCRQRLLYKSGNTQIHLKDFIGLDGGKIIVREGYSKIDPQSLQLYAGLGINNTKVFLGDVTRDGYPIVMYKGRICEKSDCYRDLVDGEVII